MCANVEDALLLLLMMMMLNFSGRQKLF